MGGAFRDGYHAEATGSTRHQLRERMSKLPAAEIVRRVYRGGYEGLGAAWGEFGAGIEAEPLRARDVFWESYTSGPESSPAPGKWCTELDPPRLAS